MSEDAELLRRYAEERCEAAFAELVRRHVNLVYFAALRQMGGDPHRAQDVAQSVFTDLARKASMLAGRATLTGWLHTSTRFAAAKARRTDATWHKREQEANTMRELLRESSSTAEWERLRPMIDDAIHELNDRDREAVLLRFFEGRSFADIGATLKLSEDGARMRVDRALEKMRAVLGLRGVGSTAAALAAAFANQVAVAAPAEIAAAVARVALAEAATKQAATAMLINFMTTTKVTVALGIAAVLAVMTAGYQTRAARAAADWRMEDDNERTIAHARLTGITTRVEAAESQQSRLEQRLVRLRNESMVAPAAAPNVAQLKWAAMLPAIDSALSGDPELRRFRLQRLEANARNDYLPLFKEFHFTPEQIQQFVDLAVQCVLRSPNQGISAADNQVSGSGLQITDDELISGLRSRLGDAVAERYLHLAKSLGARHIVSQIASEIYYLDSPFTAQQAERLTQIIDEAKTGDLRKIDALNWRHKVDWDRVLAQAQPVLSAPQVHGLRALIAQFRFLSQKRGESAQ